MQFLISSVIVLSKFIRASSFLNGVRVWSRGSSVLPRGFLPSIVNAKRVHSTAKKLAGGSDTFDTSALV